MAVSQIIGASIADGTIAAIDITDGTITTAKLAATTGSGNVVLSAAPTLTGNTSLVNLTVSGTQTNSTLTSGRVRYSTTGGLLTDSSNLQFDGTNLGVGVTPSSWFTVFKAVQIGGNFSGTPFAGALTGQTNDAAIALYNNAYINTSAVETYYSSSSHGAAKYRLNANVHEWFTAPVGTAGNAITFTQAMTLDASGYLGIGTTTPSSYGGLAVRKAATVSSVPVSASFSDSANSTFDIRHSANIVNLSAQGSGITINTGNSTRMTITDEGLVGIGTGSPYGLLNIKGSNGQLVLANGNTSGGMKLTASNSIYTGNGYLAFEGYANEYGRFDSSGNFGIGTTSPNTPLQVNGTIKSYTSSVTNSNLLLRNSTTGDAAGFGLQQDGVNTYIYNNSNGLMAFATNGTERMRISAAGLVGIGTTSPNTLFSVTHVASAETSIGIQHSSNNAQLLRMGWNDSIDYTFINTSNGTRPLVLQNTGGNVGVGVNPSDKLHIENGTLRISGTTAQAIYLYGAATVKPYITLNEYGIINFYIGAGSTTSGVLSLNGGSVGSSSGLHIKASNGYVGIGTSSPSAQLNVVGGVTFQNTTLEFGNVTTSANQYILQYMASGNGYYSYMGVNGASAGVIDVSGLSDNAVFYGSRSNVPLQFLTNNTVRATITNGGSVGIGTTSPNTLFTVGATTLTGAEISTYTTSTAGGDSSKFSFWRNYTNGSSAPFRAAYISNINSDDSYNGSNAQFLGFFTKSGTAEPVERMRIDSAGSLLVGTTNSQAPFVNGSTQAVYRGIFSKDNSSTAFDSAIGQLAIDNINTTTNNYSQLAFTTSDGANRVVTAGIYAQITARSSANWTTSNLQFYTGTVGGPPTEKMRITNDGSVAITQTPGKYTIDVIGGATSIANGGTVDFPSASGMLIVNNWTDGQVTIYLCGGGSTGVVANVAGTQVGSFAYNGAVSGYRWTNNYGSTATFGFFFVRTRNTA